MMIILVRWTRQRTTTTTTTNINTGTCTSIGTFTNSILLFSSILLLQVRVAVSIILPTLLFLVVVALPSNKVPLVVDAIKPITNIVSTSTSRTALLKRKRTIARTEIGKEMKSISTNMLQMNRNNVIAFLDRTLIRKSSSYHYHKQLGTKKGYYYYSSSSSTVLQQLQQQEEFKLANRLDGLDSPTVWQEFSPLAVQYKSINLGQGFPDWEPPNFVKQCMYDAIYIDNTNQYARAYAHLPLASVLASDYTTRWSKSSLSQNENDDNSNSITIDPTTMVATAVGCTNVLYCALHGLLNPGDEVICFEPSFDIYLSQVRMAGGVPVFVPFRDPSTDDDNNNNNNNNNDPTKLQYANDKFTIDFNELEAAITPKTKVLLINTPHNPTGKMFTLAELEMISSIVQKHPQITIISDEVYEHIVFTEDDGSTVKHISIASLPNMFERTLTLSSSGKTFSCTGWKVGWAIGPEHLIKAVTAVQQWVNFSAPTPNQHAIAKALQIARQPYTVQDSNSDDDSTEISYNTYYDWLASDYQRKRQLLINALQTAGMKPIIPHGGFFIMADTSNINFPYNEQYKYQITDAMPKLVESTSTSTNTNTIYYMPRDWALSRWLTEIVGVTAIPPSAFYCTERVPLAKNYLRFAFCKGDTTLIQAHERLESYFTNNSNNKVIKP
jgi:kynurenine---oxoglutarate transaminase / cysteine-S-conjugate beta-lyase / glutamine---phenylpyruvate transaminase